MTNIETKLNDIFFQSFRDADFDDFLNWRNKVLEYCKINSKIKSKRGYGPALKKRSDSPDIDQRFDIIEKTKSGKFILWNTDRTRVLGTHSSYEEALAQERAIEISKHQKKDESHETIDDSEISEFLSESDDDELQQEREHLQQLFESGEIDEEDFDELMGFLSGMKIAVIGDAIEAIDELELEQLREDSKNEPTNKKLWAEAIFAAKRKFKIYPSAYANLWASRYYSRKGGKWRIARSDSFEVILDDWRSELQGNVEISAEECLERLDDLREWLRERWLALNASGRVVGVCGSGKTRGKVKCLPESKIKSMSPAERIAAVRRKRKEDPNPDRKGKAIHVSTHGKQDEQDTENRSDDSTPVRRVLKWRNGLEIGVQYLPFSKRHGRTITAAYGHIRTLKGADGMALDCWVNTKYADPETKIFVVEQIINGKFDEEKLIIGCYTKEEARSLYIANMPIEMFGGIQEITMQELESRRVAKPLTVDAESIEVTGDILNESEFDELGAIDILATLERIIEGGDG